MLGGSQIHGPSAVNAPIARSGRAAVSPGRSNSEGNGAAGICPRVEAGRRYILRVTGDTALNRRVPGPDLVAPGVLSPAARAIGLQRAQTEQFDVIVIGGGVTGCGSALDAASRGLRVCLVEQRDFASGTSSRSSKLVHGGLRYLEQLDFGLVREALHERRVLLEDVAPHLVRPAPFLLPLRKHYERLYLGAGVLLYDLLAGRNPGLPRHRRLSKAGCLDAVPSLNPDALVGGIQYYDAQIDDARHTAVLARTASLHGAICLSGVAVNRVLIEAGHVVGVEAVDVDTGAHGRDRASVFKIATPVVVNATGVWTTLVEESAGVANPLRVRASKGIHVVVPRERIRSSTGLILRTEKSVLFLIPWGDRWVIGTTDTDWTYDLDHPSANASDVAYVLDHANTVLAEKLTTADVVGVYAGLRPLVAGGETSTTKLSREHAVNISRPGLVSIAGGKYTTYRLMAADAIDAAGTQLGRPIPPSRTADIALLGAVGREDAPTRLRAHRGAAYLAPDVVSHLVARYGSTASEVLDLIAADPLLARPVSLERPGSGEHVSGDPDAFDPGAFDAAHRAFLDGGRYLAAEVCHAVLYEGARHLDDVLTRRTRISIEADDRGVSAAFATAAAMAPALDWDAAAVDAEVAHYRRRVDAERAAERAPDDASSSLARGVERDVRVANRV